MSNPRRLVEAVEVTEDGIHIVRLMRIFDAASVDEFEKVLAYLMARGHFKLVVDLTNVEFVASAGWGALTAEFRRVHDNGGDIRLAGMNPDVLDVFFLLELDSFMGAYDTLETALSSFETEQSPTPPAWQETPSFSSKFETVAATDPVIEETDHIAGEASPAPVPAIEKEAKRKKSQRASKTAKRQKTSDAPSASETMPAPALTLAPPSNVSPKESIPAEAAPQAKGDASAVVEKARVEARDNANAAAPAPPRSVSKKSKTQNKTKTSKSKSSKPASSKQEQISKPSSPEQEKNTDAVPAQRALAGKAIPASPGNGEDRNTAVPETFEQGGSAFDDIEMQDIHDPWLSDEIDSLPEEFEMEEGSWQEPMDFGGMEPGSPQQDEIITPVRPARLAAANKEGEATVQAKRPQRARSAIARRPVTESDGFAAPPSSNFEGAAKKSATVKMKRSSSRKRVSVSVAEDTAAEVVPTLGNLPIARQTHAKSSDTARALPRPLHESTKIVKASSEEDYVELVRQIVKEHPHYGPTMIGKFFETRVEPPVQTSRSTIYRWLRLAGLNTRDQRLGFAGKIESTDGSEA